MSCYGFFDKSLNNQQNLYTEFAHIMEKKSKIINKFVSESGIDINIKDARGNTLLISECKYPGDANIIKKLLKIPGIDYNAVNKNGVSALINASTHNHVNCVIELLKMPDININQQTYYKKHSALTRAYLYNNIKIFKLLLKNPDINVDTYYNIVFVTSILLDACKGNRIEFIKLLLLDKKIKINYRSYADCMSPFMTACKYGHIEIVKILLEVPDININYVNYDNHNALMIAKKEGHNEIVKMINNFIIDKLKNILVLPEDILRIIVENY